MKLLYLHLPNLPFPVQVETEEDTFDDIVEELANVLTKKESCWISIVPFTSPDGTKPTESHIFLTESMKGKVFLRIVVE